MSTFALRIKMKHLNDLTHTHTHEKERKKAPPKNKKQKKRKKEKKIYLGHILQKQNLPRW